MGSLAGLWRPPGRLDTGPGRADGSRVHTATEGTRTRASAVGSGRRAMAVAAAGAGAAGRCDDHVRCGCSCADVCSCVAVVDRRRLTKPGGAGVWRAGTRLASFLAPPHALRSMHSLRVARTSRATMETPMPFSLSTLLHSVLRNAAWDSRKS